MMRSARRAFTLLEMITVVAIIALLVGLLIPALTAARNAMDAVNCITNMRQIGLGILEFGKDGRALAGNIHDDEQTRWIVLKGGPALDNQEMTGKLIKQLELNRKVFQCPVYKTQTELGGDQVMCHYAVPTILSNMPLTRLRSAYYKVPENKLPGVPILVEPQVYHDEATDKWFNSLGHAEDAFSTSTGWSTTALPKIGGFENTDKLDNRRHSKRFHMAFHNKGVASVTLSDEELDASQLFIIIENDDGDSKTIDCGGENDKDSWRTKMNM